MIFGRFGSGEDFVPAAESDQCQIQEGDEGLEHRHLAGGLEVCLLPELPGSVDRERAPARHSGGER